MPYLVYREANKSDVTSLARVRAENQAYEEFWHERIRLYMDQKHHPQIWQAQFLQSNLPVGSFCLSFLFFTFF